MSFRHRELAAGRWNSLSLVEQLAHTGSEVERALNWKEKGNLDYSGRAADRALELLTLTVTDPKNLGRLRELTRVREALADFFYGDNSFRSTDASWRRYFRAFAYAAQVAK